MLDFKTIPPLMVTDDLPKKRIEKYYKPPTPELIAYLDFSVSTTGVLSGVKVSTNPVDCCTIINFLCLSYTLRCHTLLSWGCAEHTNTSVSSTLLEKWQSVWILTLDWDFSFGDSQGKSQHSYIFCNRIQK